MTGLVVKDVTVSGQSVSFVAVELRMAKFDLTLDPDGRMKGTISTPQGPVPVELKVNHSRLKARSSIIGRSRLEGSPQRVKVSHRRDVEHPIGSHR